MTVIRVWTLLVSASVLGLAAGSRGWDDQGPRRYSPYAEVMRVRRQQQQGPQRAPGVRIKPFGPQRGQPQRPVDRRQLALPQNRRLVPAAPVEAPRQPARPVPAASNQAEKRILKTYKPEYNDYDYEPEPVQYKREPQPEQYRRQPEPERPQRVYEPEPVYERSPVRADKRQDSVIGESIAVPREQHDLEASVHAAANGYRGESYADPQRLAFQVHGQGGPHSYRFGYDTGVGYNRQFRYEERDANGVLHGRYGYYDQEGKLQVVNYTADPVAGFHAEGEHVPKPQY